MSPVILGVSGSPVPNSNTDRAVKGVLQASGLESEFVKLSEINVKPCQACKQCVPHNICQVNDDFSASKGMSHVLLVDKETPVK